VIITNVLWITMSELEIECPSIFTIGDTTFLEVKPKNGAYFVKNMQNDSRIQSFRGTEFAKSNSATRLVQNNPVIAAPDRTNPIYEKCGNYLVFMDKEGISFMNTDLDTKLRIKLAHTGSTHFLTYYYSALEVYAIETCKNAKWSVVFYDKNLKHIRTFLDRVQGGFIMINNYMLNNGVFFDIFSKDTVGTDTVLVKRFDIDEVIARSTYGSETIKYFLRRIVFSDHECAVCNVDLSKNGRFCIVPCGHTNVCGSCLAGLKICPNCRKPISSNVKMFI
jgi:hypothetical protein